MSYDNTNRIFYGIIDYQNLRESETGRINIILEETENGFVGVDKSNPFCPTGQVFVTKEFNKLASVYSANQNAILRVEAIKTRNELVNENDCLYITSGLVGGRVAKADPKKIPVQVIDMESIKGKFDIYLPNDGQPLLSKFFAGYDADDSVYTGPWLKVQTEVHSEKMNEDYTVSICEPADIYSGVPHNSVYSLPSSKLNRNDIIVSEFLSPSLSSKYGVIKFLNSKDLLQEGERTVHPTSMFIALALKEYLNKKKTPLASAKRQWSYLANIVRTHKSDFAILQESGFTRLVDNLEKTQEVIDLIDSQVEEFIQTPKGREVARVVIEDNFEKLIDKKQKDRLKARLKEKDKEVGTKQEELDRLQQLIKEAKQERSKIEDSIISKRKELESSVNLPVVETKEIEANLNAEHKKLLSERDDLLEEIEKLKLSFKEAVSELNVLSGLKEAREEKESLDNYIRLREKVKDSLDERIRRIEDQIEDRNEQLLDKINDIAPHIHAVLRGRKGREPEAKWQFEYQSPVVRDLPDLYQNSENAEVSFISDLCVFLSEKYQEKDREYSPIFIANLLVSIHVNFLNFLHGKPGMGKTSAIRHLKEFMQMGTSYLEVNVAKGWDSERDWIGLFNTLNREFSPSRTGVYPYLKALSSEAEDIASPLILLDEANLSTMEHYWYQFIGMADSESEMVLNLDGGTRLPIDKDLRFVGTINNDHTTQPLSERMVSRSGVIFIDGAVSSQYVIDVEPLSEEAVEFFTNNVIEKSLLSNSIRGVIKSDEFEDESRRAVSILDGFVEELNLGDDLELPQVERFELSKRTLSKVHKYISASVGVMGNLISKSSQDCDAELVAADYAILQFIIPSIRMDSENAKARLEQARAYCSSNGLMNSSEKLLEVIVGGENNLGQYGIFNG